MTNIIEKLATDFPQLKLSVEDIVNDTPENVEKLLLSLIPANPVAKAAIHIAISSISTYASDILKSKSSLSVVSDGVIRIIEEDTGEKSSESL